MLLTILNDWELGCIGVNDWMFGMIHTGSAYERMHGGFFRMFVFIEMDDDGYRKTVTIDIA
jgi:hypothetical protein